MAKPSGIKPPGQCPFLRKAFPAPASKEEECRKPRENFFRFFLLPASKAGTEAESRTLQESSSRRSGAWQRREYRLCPAGGRQLKSPRQPQLGLASEGFALRTTSAGYALWPTKPGTCMLDKHRGLLGAIFPQGTPLTLLLPPCPMLRRGWFPTGLGAATVSGGLPLLQRKLKLKRYLP